jgi:hypothetical protein
VSETSFSKCSPNHHLDQLKKIIAALFDVTLSNDKVIYPEDSGRQVREALAAGYTGTIRATPFENGGEGEHWLAVRELSKKLAPAVEIEEQSYKQIEESHPSSMMNISMMVLGGFIAVAGIAAVAIALTVLNVATLGSAGLIVAGVTATLVGVGLFATNAYKSQQLSSYESLSLSEPAVI